jgi:peptide/nickel transport system permease protein
VSATTAADLQATPSARALARRETLRALARSKTFVIGVAILLWWVFCAFFGAKIAPHPPDAQYIYGTHSDVLSPPSGRFLFGTDGLGRDVFSRVLAGARSILEIAPAATALAVLAGTSLGLITGYMRGWADDAVSRLTEALLAIPLTVLAVAIVVALGKSTLTLIVVVGVLFTPPVCRTVRAAVLAERDLDYVTAAQLRGEGAWYVMFAEILPNIAGAITVETTVRLGYAVFAIAGLSFLGFGVQPPTPDWAADISQSYTLLATGNYWWTVLFPALAIISLVIAINLVADGLTQALER